MYGIHHFKHYVINLLDDVFLTEKQIRGIKL